MFRNLRTRTKLFILCSTFILAIGMTIHSLVVEKQIAIDFARDELVGNDSLTIVRGISAAVLTGQSLAPHLSESKLSFPGQPAASRANLQTAEQEKALAVALGALQEDQSAGRKTGTRVLDALAGAQALASRIGDDSKLKPCRCERGAKSRTLPSELKEKELTEAELATTFKGSEDYARL